MFYIYSYSLQGNGAGGEGWACLKSLQDLESLSGCFSRVAEGNKECACKNDIKPQTLHCAQQKSGVQQESTIIREDTRTLMLIAALFTIAKTWKQPQCPSTDEWIKKM